MAGAVGLIPGWGTKIPQAIWYAPLPQKIFKKLKGEEKAHVEEHRDPVLPRPNDLWQVS